MVTILALFTVQKLKPFRVWLIRLVAIRLEFYVIAFKSPGMKNLVGNTRKWG